MLSASQRTQFEETGVLRLEQAVEPEAVARMRDRLWKFIEAVHGFVRHDPATWEPGGRPTGFQKLVRSDAFAEMGSARLRAATEELLGPNAARAANHWGQPLPAFPEPGPWCVPHDSWHMDLPASGSDDRCSGFRAFLLLDRLESQGGATLVVTGSQRVARRAAREAGERMKSGKAKKVLASREPWIRDLFTPSDDRERFLEAGKASDGTPLRVVELVGEAGDAILMDLCALHTVAPNVRPTPRLMIGQGLYREIQETVRLQEA